MVRYKLDAVDFSMAWTEGILRRAHVINHKFQTNNPSANKRAELMWDVGAAMAEVAVARYLGQPWTGRLDGEYRPDVSDVGTNIEVRYATGHGPLRIRERDLEKRPSTIYVLAWIDSVWTDDQVHLPGWITIGEAVEVAIKQTRFENIVYEIEPQHLRPMNRLKCQPTE